MRHDVPSWSVTATLDEPLALVQAFVAWHLALGAAEVVLYFDRPDDPAAAALQDMPQVRVIRCGPGHWAGRQGARPVKHQVRQVHNATLAYRECRTDWLLHCDADEFLWPQGPVAEALAAVHPQTDAAIIAVAERVYAAGSTPETIFDGAFRRPFAGSPAQGEAVYGASYAMTRRGMTGHAQGKVFARAGRGLELSIHRPKPQPGVVLQPCAGAELLHFDGLTPLQWRFKLLRKAEHFARHGGMEPSPHRQRQIDAILGDPAAAGVVHDALKTVTAPRLAQLRRLGLLLTADFDPQPALARFFGAVDLSVAGFDAALLRGPAADYPDLHAALRA